MQTRIAKVVLTLQLVSCFLLMLFVVTASFQTGLVATKAERLSKALQGAQNEFSEHSVQAQVSTEIADWIQSVRGLHLALIAIFMAFAVSAAIGIAGCSSTGKSSHSVPPTATDSTAGGG